MRGRDYVQQLAIQAAKRAGIDPDLYTRVIKQESGFNPDALSPAGARGPAQIMPDTGRDPGFGVKPWDGTLEDNLRFGADYLASQINRYGGNNEKALAAYNWGAGNADKWNGNRANLPGETQGYLNNILGGYQPGRPQGGGMDATSLADDAMGMFPEGQQQSNSPVTLDQEPEEKKGITFHPGMGLQSIGAAIAAGQRGESAAGDLDSIRQQYFAQMEAEEERAAKERARVAAIQMVGADTPYGQALAQGADPQMVMEAYQQERGFDHDFSIEGVRNQNATIRDQLGYQHQSRENEADRAIDTRRLDITEDENENSAARWREEMDRTLEETRRAAETDAATGEAARDLIAEQYETAGDAPGAAEIRSRPASAFTNPQITKQFLDVVQGSGQTDLQKGLEDAKEYLRLQEQDPALAQAFWEARGHRTSTSTTGANLSTDYRLAPDGTAEPIPGSPADQKARADAASAAAANEAAASNTVNRSSSVLRALDRATEHAGVFGAGPIGQMTGWIGGTSGRQLRAELSTVAANIAFDRLGAMRAESPTGGALGSVTEGELKLLSDTIAAIDPNQRPEALRENLAYIREQYTYIVQKVIDSDASPAEKQRALDALGAGSASQDEPEDDDALINKYMD